MESNFVVTQGALFDVIGVADAAIGQMAEKYLPLKINGIDDKTGYKIVHEARMICKSTRVKVEKHGKEMRENAVKYQKAVITEEKRILGLIEPIETHLQTEEKAVDDAVEAIKQEAARKEAARIQARIDRLEADYGMGLFGQNYKLPFEAPGTEVPLALLKVCTDEQFEKFCAAIQAAVGKEQIRVAEIEQKRLIEEKRMAEIALEQETERQRLAAVALAQAEEERKARLREKLEADERERKETEIRAAQKKIDDERAEWEMVKKAEADARRHAQELEVVRKEAAEKAKLEAEEFVRQNALRLAEKERIDKIAAEKKEARKPDKEKLLGFVDYLEAMIPPTMKTPEGKDILMLFQTEFTKLVEMFRNKVMTL